MGSGAVVFRAAAPHLCPLPRRSLFTDVTGHTLMVAAFALRLAQTRRRNMTAAQRRKRTQASARAAGAAFERLVADYLSAHVDDRIDRRVKTGAKDKGDIAGVRVHGQRVVLECKDTAVWSPGPWLAEAEVERVNDGALVGAVVAKRHGKAAPEEQVVLMRLEDLAALLAGCRA